ncbi:hypothetical protein [Pontibacter sp. G13]|uniref:hypothetical protein n=1 Tax=Pontibacter sp. G13 TaxID=3074898 RepID=UPI00288BC4D0|nr:hypothetical protein [Pontibacter sp. G13]WNJ20354.1 hypothetical protein RJD25_07725 [Pontibacter sp. G13]
MKRILTYLICVLILSCQSKTEKQNIEEVEIIESPTLTEDSETFDKLDTLLNTTDYLILGKKIGKVIVVEGDEIDNFPTYEILIGYRNEVIIGENIDYSDVEIYRKYNPKTSFKDYQVAVYEGKLADPDFSTDPDAKRFITRIKNECAKGINFAGQYTLVTWGCGSPCQSGVVVDRKTGAIFGGYGTVLGSEFQKDSKMIIRNVGAIDTTKSLIEVCAYCDVNHEIWTGTEFIEIE